MRNVFDGFVKDNVKSKKNPHKDNQSSMFKVQDSVYKDQAVVIGISLKCQPLSQ